MDNVHDFKNHYSGKNCMPPELNDRHYFKLSDSLNEKRIAQFLKYLKDNLNL